MCPENEISDIDILSNIAYSTTILRFNDKTTLYFIKIRMVYQQDLFTKLL